MRPYGLVVRIEWSRFEAAPAAGLMALVRDEEPRMRIQAETRRCGCPSERCVCLASRMHLPRARRM
jgi:hypothetical protein